MGIFNPPKNKEFENLKPYYIVNGSLTKEGHPFCTLWEKYYLPYFNGIENGIDKTMFNEIVKREHLDKIPDGDGYGGYRKIVFSEGEMIGRAWVNAVFQTELIIGKETKAFYVVTCTGERGSEGERCYFEVENIALAYLIAHLRSMKNKYKE